MKRPAVILGRQESWHVQRLVEAAGRLGRATRVVPFERLVGELGRSSPSLRCGDFELLDASSVVVRGIPPGGLERIVFRMDALQRLENAGVEVVNPARAIECCVDKYLATARLAAAGLPVPRTIVCESLDNAMVAFEALGGKAILKPLFGSEGRGICMLDNPAIAYRILRAAVGIQAIVYLQEWIENPGFDVRALVLNGRVIASMRRTATVDFRANVACGGRAEALPMSPEWEMLAVASARAVGAVFAGIDLLPSIDGKVFVLEANSVPGFQAISQATGVDVAGELMRSLRQ